jgi:hypothetical protein
LLLLAVVLAAEVAAILLVAPFVSPDLASLLLPVVPCTAVVWFTSRRLLGRRDRRQDARGLSPEAIVKYRREETPPATPEALSRAIAERAGEIRRVLADSPSAVRVDMCALGYRACANDMITLTHLTNEELRTAGPLRRLQLRHQRRRAAEALSAAREALPPEALRAMRQEL